MKAEKLLNFINHYKITALPECDQARVFKLLILSKTYERLEITDDEAAAFLRIQKKDWLLSKYLLMSKDILNENNMLQLGIKESEGAERVRRFRQKKRYNSVTQALHVTQQTSEKTEEKIEEEASEKMQDAEIYENTALHVTLQKRYCNAEENELEKDQKGPEKVQLENEAHYLYNIDNSEVIITTSYVDSKDKDIKKENKKRKKDKSEKYSDDFQKFWAAYPNLSTKGSKPVAARSFEKSIKLATIEEIMNGVEKYEAYLRTSGRYQKHASTWLNHQDWATEWKTPEETAPQTAEVLSMEKVLDFEKNIQDVRWKTIRKNFIARYGKDHFISWIIDMSASEQENNQIILFAETRFKKEWIENHYLDFLKKEWMIYNLEVKILTKTQLI